MNKLLFVIVAVLLGCNSNKPQKATKDTVITTQAVPMPTISASADTTVVYSPTNYAPADTLEGDFNGDGKKELAWVKLVKEGSGNPAEDGIPDEYAVLFSDSALPAIKIDCCDTYLVREGDLNNDGKDDLSTFQAPMNGFTFYMRTWTLTTDKWDNVLDPFMVPTGGDEFTRADLENTVFLKDGKLYFTEIEVNDGFKKVIKPVSR